MLGTMTVSGRASSPMRFRDPACGDDESDRWDCAGRRPELGRELREIGAHVRQASWSSLFAGCLTRRGA
jgi:hypothetical protein